MIAAILKTQLLSMRMRRGGSHAGTAFSVFTGLLFYGFWTFLAWGAMLYFSQADQQPYFLPVLSGGLAIVMLYWQLAPIISASMGASIDLRKLLAYPIPHSKLFTLEVLLRITACGEMVIILIGISVGLIRNPLYGLRQAPAVFLGAALFTLTNILLSAGTRSWVEHVLLRGKFKEALMFLFVMLGIAPQLFVFFNVKKAALLRFAPSQAVWPWASVARVMLLDSLAMAATASIVWLGVAYVFSRWNFERTLRADAVSPAQVKISGKTDGFTERFFQFPSRFLKDPVAAIVEKELRTLARVPRFRMVFLMSCVFGVMMMLPVLRTPEKHPLMLQLGLPIMALYGLLMLGQISYWNSLGLDRSAVQGYFSWPIRFRDVLIAKNISVVFILLPQIFVLSVIARFVKLNSGPAKVLETVIVIGIASLYWFAMGNIFSVRMPRAMNPEKSSQISRQTSALTIWCAPFLLLPLVLAYWARWFFENELVFTGLVLVSAIIGGIFYYVGLDSAVTMGNARREAIITKLSETEGPLSSS